MFISRVVYQTLQDELTKARAELAAQSKANQMLEATMNWFRHRLTQIEQERAYLIQHTLGVKIPAPAFESQNAVDAQKRFMDEHFHESNIFRSLSDTEAAKEGIEWDDDGRLKTN